MPDDTALTSGRKNRAPLTILVVEDDTSIGTLLAEIIRCETPHRPLLVTDSMQALRMIDTFQPNLFILDYCLPGMNGIELYDYCHRMKGLEHIPAIMISARLPKEEIVKRNIVGLRKPFELDELLTTIEKALN